MVNIAIPSANRAGRTRSSEQLDALEGQADVYWVVPEAQYDAYRRATPGWQRILTLGGPLEVAHNGIMRYFAGSDVVVMDDDVPWYIGCRKVFAPRPGNAPKTPRLNVVEVASYGFQTLDHFRSLPDAPQAWGVYPVPYSGTALKPRLGVGTAFLVGHTVGLRIPAAGPGFAIQTPIKQDYEMTARLLDRDGAVARLDFICAYSVVGGAGDNSMGGFRTKESEAKAAEWLQQEWPHLFKPAQARDGLAQVAITADVKWYDIKPEKGWFE